MILDLSEFDADMVKKIEGAIEKETDIRNFESEINKILVYHDIEIHQKEEIVYRNGRQVHLSHQEFLALTFLAQHPRWVFSKEQIYEQLYGQEQKENIENIIYCLIRNLRKKIEPNPQHPQYIQNIRGAGYKFVIPEN